MSALHTLYKQLSHKWLVCTLLATALFGMGGRAFATNEVMVSVSALYDIMPPDASVYKETPEKFFVVNINNPQDHTLTIYLTMKLEKITGDKFIMEQKVTAKPQSPMFAITLPASTSITLTSSQLHNHFRHLVLGNFNITGSLLGDVMSSNFGLLPEGDYMATLTAYEYDPSEVVVESTKEAISDPKLSTTHFKICYSVKAPVMTIPTTFAMSKFKMPGDEEEDAENAQEPEKEPKRSFSGVDYEIPDVNFGNTNTWYWMHLMEVCGQLPNMNYELEFFSMKNGAKGYATSPENAIAEGNDRVLVYPGTMGPTLRNVQTATFAVPNPKSYFQEGEYYAVRVHAIPADGIAGSVSAKLASFRMYENNGYSAPIVVRAVYEEVGGEPGIPVIPGDGQEQKQEQGQEHNKNWKATVTHPKLTFPDNNGNCFGAVYIEAEKDYEATWEKPEFVEGDRAFADKFDYTYNIDIYKAPDDAASFDDIITKDNKPLYSVKDLKFEKEEELKHLVPWKTLSEERDSITLGGHYFIEVTANPVPKAKEGELLFCARGQNCCTYTMFLTEDIVYEDCGALEEYEDKKVVSHGETIEKQRGEMNGFHVVFTSLKATDKEQTTYSGTGYVKWQPLGMSTYIAMSFSGIRLNKDMQVLAGTGTARKMANADVIPYDLIDYAAAKAGNWVQNTSAYQALSETASTVGEALKTAAQWVDDKAGIGAENKLNEAQQTAQNKVQELYDAHVTKYRDPDEVAKACGDYWTKYIMPGRNIGNTMLNWFTGGSYDDVDTDASPTFLPIGLPQSFLPDSLDMDFQVMKFDISPTRASVGVAAFFYMPDAVRIDKAGEEVKDGTRLSTVLAFVAPRLCVKPQEIWAKEGEFGLLYDFSIKDMNTGYTFTFLAPTDYTKLNDGCAIHWEQVKGETKVNMMVLDAKMTIPGLLNEDRSRTAEMRIGARIDNWSDWMAWIVMDAFQVEDLDGYVFNVTGANGIRLDHSRVKNPDLKDASGNAITISSIFKDVRRGDDTDKRGYNWAHPKLGFQGVPEGKDPLNWMGLYVDEISMTFPKSLSISDKSDGESKPVKLGLRNLLWDNSGVSLTAFVGSKKNPVVKLETGRVGGWALSLDEVTVNVLQSKFSDCHFSGMFEVPLLKGTFDYECKMNYVAGEELGQLYKEHDIGPGDLDEKKFHLTFKTQQRDDMRLDFWLGDVHVDKDGSWFNLDYLDGDTKVEFMASGTITVGEANEDKTGGQVGDIPFEIPGIRFAGLRMANFKYDTSRDFAATYAENLSKKGLKENKTLYQAGLNKELSEADFEGGSVDNPFYFNIGKWSLASEEKKMWGFPLGLKDIGVDTDTENKRIGLKFTGTLGLLGGGKDSDGDGEDDSWSLNAGAGMTIWAKYEFNGFDDLANASISYDTFEFHKLEFDGSFGGGLVTVKGELEWQDNDEEKGFEGDLTLGIKELFDVTVAGSIKENKKDDYKHGFFYANVGDVSIPCGPTGVTINRISCGFFWNRTMPADTKLDDKEKFREAMASGGKPYKGAFGLTFGLGLAFANESLCGGDFNGFMGYDLKNDALSRLTLLGDMEALKGPGAKKGLLSARVKVDYVDNVADVKAAQEQMDAGNKNVTPVERCQSFTLNATVDFKADTKEAIEQFLGEGALDNLEGSLKEAADAVKKSGMAEFGADAADDDNKGDGKTSGKDDAKDNLSASMGASFSFEFQLRHYRDSKKTKWHVYLGEPSRGKRCEIVFIDFKFDAKLLKVWAKAYANAYICIGNELPKDENGVEGGLPPLPDKVAEILDDKEKQSDKVESNVGNKSSLMAERAQQIQSGPSGAGIKGGIQFGGEVGAEFGVEIPIGYVKAGAIVGFDAILKQYGDCACSDGSKLGGKNGFYAMAQLYAAIWGSAGVHLDFGFWSGDFPLVEMALAAVLKGGFPNPTWVYGKMRVKGQVLGGLISFNKSMELRMGKVCVPEVASPLDNIDIFSSYTVGSEDKDAGWGKKGNGDGAQPHDPYVMPSFTTNMDMDSYLRLVDENEMNTKAGLDGNARAAEASSTKTFVFHLERNATLQPYSNEGAEMGAAKYCDMTPAQNSRTSYTVNTGSFNQNQNYKLHVRGFVKQIIDGREQDPIIRNLETHKDEQKPWGQNLDLYFRTGKWSDDLSQEVMLFIPFDKTGVILEDARNPYFCIANDRQDLFNSPDKEWYVNMEVNRGTESNPKWQYPDVRYDANGNRTTSERSKWEHIGVELTTEYDGTSRFHSVGLTSRPGDSSPIEKNTQYRFSLYSVDKKQMNDDLGKIKEARKSVVSGQADVIETLTLLAYDEQGNMTDLGKDMMAWYNEQTAAGNNISGNLDQVDQIINSFEKEKLSDLRYTSLEFQHEFTTGSCETFAKKLNSYDSFYSEQELKFQKRTVTRAGGAISARLKERSNRLSSSYSTNPYFMLNWWATRACVSMMPPHRFTSKEGRDWEYEVKNAELFTFTFSPEWHGNYRPVSKQWNDWAFEQEVSPFYATEWRRQGKYSSVRGTTLCSNMVDSVCRVLYADGKLAADLPKVLRNTWELYEAKAVGLQSNGVNKLRDKSVNWEYSAGRAIKLWNEASGIEDLRDFNKGRFDSKAEAFGYTTAFKNNDTSWKLPENQILCIFTCDVYNEARFAPLWMWYKTYKKVPPYTETHSRTGVIRRAPTNAIYWIAGEAACNYELTAAEQSQYNKMNLMQKVQFSLQKIQENAYPFSMSDYLASIKQLTFEIRRPNGFDASTGKYLLRPSTRFGNLVDMTQKVTLTDNSGSVKITNGGSPTFKEDNNVYFDDPNFEKYIIANFDTNRDGKLTKDEALKIKYINYNGREKGSNNGQPATITNLRGIEAMTNLESLKIDRITITNKSHANLSANKKLRNVKFTYNWTSVSSSVGVRVMPDLSTLPALDSLTINHHLLNREYDSNQFGGLSGYLDVSALKHLKYLSLSGNKLTQVDGLNELSRLESLDLRGNLLTKVNASQLTRPFIYVGQQYKYSSSKYVPLKTSDPWIALTVNVAYSKESNLIANGADVGTTRGSISPSMSNYHVKVTKWNDLKAFIAKMPDRKLITYIVQNYKTKSSRPSNETLDDFATKFPGQSDMYIAGSWLNWFTLDESKIVKNTSLNVDNKDIKSLEGLEKVMPALRKLQCNNNSIEELDASLFPDLMELYCANNRIIDLKFEDKLTYLNCSYNALTRLDASKAPKLITIYCDNNALQEIILTGNTKLTTLECQNNQLQSLDASECTDLKKLDCSHNINMTDMNSADGALGVALYVPRTIKKLIARGIYTYSTINNKYFNLPELEWLDLSDNPGIKGYVGTTSDTKLSHLDLHNTNITELKSAGGLAYLDLSNTMIKGNNSENAKYYRFFVNMYDNYWKKLKTLNLTDTPINQVYVNSNISYILDSLFVGAPHRTSGRKVELQMDNPISSKWGRIWKYDPRNQYVYAHVGNGQRWVSSEDALVKTEGQSEDDKAMQDDLGEELYQRLKERYSPDSRWLHTNTVANEVKELDCSNMNIDNINRIVKWMPSLERLNCSYNHITSANFSKLLKLKRLKIAHNYELTSVTMPGCTSDLRSFVNNANNVTINGNNLSQGTLNVGNNVIKVSSPSARSEISNPLANNYHIATSETLDLQNSKLTQRVQAHEGERLAAQLFIDGQGNSTVVFDTIDVSHTKLFMTNLSDMTDRCKVLLANNVETITGKLSVPGNSPLTYIDMQHTGITDVNLCSMRVDTLKVGYSPDLRNINITDAGTNFFVTCGGVNADVVVKLHNYSLVQKWFSGSADDTSNDHVYVTYPITTLDGQTLWAPVTSAPGAMNLGNFCKKNLFKSRISINKRDVTLTVNTSQLTSWFANKYNEGNDSVHLELPVTVAKVVKYCPVTSVDGAQGLVEMAKKLTDPDQIKISNHHIQLICHTPQELKTWYSGYHKFNGRTVTTYLRASFSDSANSKIAKTEDILVTEPDVDARINLSNFCRLILHDQLKISSDNTINIYLGDIDKLVWEGKKGASALNSSLSNRVLPFDYSKGNEDVVVHKYTPTLNKPNIPGINVIDSKHITDKTVDRGLGNLVDKTTSINGIGTTPNRGNTPSIGTLPNRGNTPGAVTNPGKNTTTTPANNSNPVIGNNVNPNVNRNANTTVNRNANSTVNRNANTNVNTNVNRNANANVNRNVNANVNRNVGSTVNRNATKR